MDKNGKSSIKDFELKVTASVFRLFHVTNKKIFDGNWAMHVFITLLNIDFSSPFVSKSNTGLSYIIIDPFILF